jgi:hypothetical protein
MQDNQLTLARNPLFSSEARAVIDLDHDGMLKQMGQRDADSFLKPVPVATPKPAPPPGAVGLPS